MKKIHIIGGGTFSHVRNHMALAAPAFGGTAKRLYDQMIGGTLANYEVVRHLTKMADSNSKLVTNDDVSALLDQLIADPDTRVIVLNAALCDYDGAILVTQPLEYDDMVVGYEYQLEKAKEAFNVDDEYTIKDCVVGMSSSYYKFEEVTGDWNTVMFEVIANEG